MPITFGNKYNTTLSGKFLHQTHSNIVQIIDNQVNNTYNIKGDALITTLKNTPLCIKTADCVPILLENSNIIAAIHAGRIGAMNGIIQNTIKVMQNICSCNDIVAYIGPCIRVKNYTLNETLYNELLCQDKHNINFFLV